MSKRKTEISGLGKMSHKGKEGNGRKVWRSYGKTEIYREAWLSDNPHKVETS